MSRPDFMTSPHSHTRAPRSTRYGQGWRDLQRHQAHVKAYEGFLNAAIAGAILWALLGGVFVILWGVML
jgi:hypothetical protein